MYERVQNLTNITFTP